MTTDKSERLLKRAVSLFERVERGGHWIGPSWADEVSLLKDEIAELRTTQTDSAAGDGALAATDVHPEDERLAELLRRRVEEMLADQGITANVTFIKLAELIAVYRPKALRQPEPNNARLLREALRIAAIELEQAADHLEDYATATGAPYMLRDNALNAADAARTALASTDSEGGE